MRTVILATALLSAPTVVYSGQGAPWTRVTTDGRGDTYVSLDRTLETERGRVTWTKNVLFKPTKRGTKTEIHRVRFDCAAGTETSLEWTILDAHGSRMDVLKLDESLQEQSKEAVIPGTPADDVMQAVCHQRISAR